MPIDYSKWDSFADSDDEGVAATSSTPVSKTAEPIKEDAAPVKQPRSSALIDAMAPVPCHDDVMRSLRRKEPVVMREGCAEWLAAEHWTWEFLAEHFESAQLHVGARGERRRPMPLIDLLGHWWPSEAAGPRRVAKVGCHTWRLFDAHPKMLRHVGNAKVEGITEVASGRKRRQLSQPSAASSQSAPSLARTSIAMGEAGYVATPLRSVAYGRHCYIACIRGAVRFLMLPQYDAELLGSREISKARDALAQIDPLHPDYDRHPKLHEVEGYTHVLTEGDVLVVPSGFLLWSENLWSSLLLRHCFVTADNMVQFHQLALRASILGQPADDVK